MGGATIESKEPALGRARDVPADARTLATVKLWLGSAVYQSVAGCLEPKLDL